MSRTTHNLRYGFIALHTLLWLIALPLCFAVTGSYLMLILFLCSGIALIIYVPAALVLSLRDSPSHFTHAGGEIAYVTIQLACWIAVAISAVILSVVSETRCYDGWSFYDDMELSIWRRPDACWALYTTAAIGFAQVVLIVAWLAIVSHKAHHTPGLKPSKAFKVPTHRLLLGNVGGGNEYGMSGVRRSSDIERAKRVVEEDD